MKHSNGIKRKEYHEALGRYLFLSNSSVNRFQICRISGNSCNLLTEFIKKSAGDNLAGPFQYCSCKTFSITDLSYDLAYDFKMLYFKGNLNNYNWITHNSQRLDRSAVEHELIQIVFDKKVWIQTRTI